MIGLIGGMSWELLVEYYWMINWYLKVLYGGYYNVKSVLVMVDFVDIEVL